MPFHRPIPGSNEPTKSVQGPNPKRPSGKSGFAQIDSLMQIAFVMPCAMAVGWFGGWCVDHFWHTGWATAVGLVLGIVAGMVSAIRIAMAAMDSLSKREDK